jgi:hypothetical protein
VKQTLIECHLTAIKTSFLKAVFANFAQRTGRLIEIVAKLPFEFVKTCTKALEATGDQLTLEIKAPANRLSPQEICGKTADSAVLAANAPVTNVFPQETLVKIVDNPELEAEAHNVSITPEVTLEHMSDGAGKTVDQPAERISLRSASKDAPDCAVEVAEEPNESISSKEQSVSPSLHPQPRKNRRSPARRPA